MTPQQRITALRQAIIVRVQETHDSICRTENDSVCEEAEKELTSIHIALQRMSTRYGFMQAGSKVTDK